MTESIPKRKSKPRKPRDISGNQGEGNREADRRYREKATEFARSERAEPAADEARRSVEGEAERDAGAGPELEELERAQREQRRRMDGMEGAPEKPDRAE
jgi:hypothetical protein